MKVSALLHVSTDFIPTNTLAELYQATSFLINDSQPPLHKTGFAIVVVSSNNHPVNTFHPTSVLSVVVVLIPPELKSAVEAALQLTQGC
jgi:hypothetical protein